MGASGPKQRKISFGIREITYLWPLGIRNRLDKFLEFFDIIRSSSLM
jgi:hypothetical protein